ncbi:MAG: hypothetical protein ACOYMB_03595 [Patescibacteria group bacterium]
MKKETTKTIIIAVFIIIWHFIRVWVQYLVDMQYSTSVAPDQLNDDTLAYQAIRMHHTVNSTIGIVYSIGLVLLIIWLIRIWWKYLKKKSNSTSE